MTLDTLHLFPYLIALAIIIAGGVVRGYTGFGSGLVMVPLLAVLWGPIDAIILTMSLGLFATVQMTYPAIKLANWRDTAPMVFAALLVTPLGTFFLITLDPGIVKKIIAVIVIFLTIISLIGWTYKGPRGITPSFIAGSIASFINGVAAVGGPVFVLYLISIPEKPEVQRANLTILTSIMGTSVLMYVVIFGDIPIETVSRAVILAIPYIAAVWSGIKLFSLLSGKIFKTIILWFLLAISSAILIA